MEADEDGALSFVISSTGTNTNQSSSIISADVEETPGKEEPTGGIRMCTSDE